MDQGAPRTVVTFQSTSFNTSQHKDYFINPGCYGDDVARWLIEKLRAIGIQTDTEPDQEDFGWYFSFTIDGVSYHLVIGYRPGAKNEPGTWIAWLEQKVGLLKVFVGAHKKQISTSAAIAIHAALSSSPAIGAIRWHTQKNFDAGQEELGEAAP